MMCKHIVFVFACQDLASGPIVTRPCRHGCGLIYMDSADLQHSLNAPYRPRHRASIDIEYINLDMMCEECDPFFNPFEDVEFDRLYDGVWHVPAVPMREMEIFRDFAWDRNARVTHGENGKIAMSVNQQSSDMDAIQHGSGGHFVIECVSPKSLSTAVNED